MGSNTITIVTGANRGIGLGICQTLVSTANYQPMILYACSRQGLDLGLSPSDPNTVIKYATLDISSQESVSSLAEEVKSELERQDSMHGEGRVVLINNAGTVVTPHNAENAKAELDVNYRGTLKMCLAFIPILGPKGRIVNVSAATLTRELYRPDIQARFSGNKVTLSSLEELVNQYERAVANDTEEREGFGDRKKAYFVGKSCVNALTSVLARENEGLVINAGCPGWVDTRMGNLGVGRPPKNLEEGARVPVRLAFGELQGTTGKFWANEKITDTGDGEIREW
ncbi:NAD(P)-binding protein [Acephala macrosclerotiorum]|nr:NAD(P)-binding protein [Acephala macrosclerotiorum]